MLSNNICYSEKQKVIFDSEVDGWEKVLSKITVLCRNICVSI